MTLPSPSGLPLVEAAGVRKRFGRVEALAGLDLVAPAGQVLALLGPNGAGKTTFVRMLATLLRPDAGTLAVAGIDVARHPERVRRAIGLAGQHAAVEPAMTGRENLTMVARLFGHGRRASREAAGAVLAQLGLTDAADRLVRTYSGGMRRRLDLGASLVGAPRLLLLDEPTTGLDPRSRIELWEAIQALVAGGTDVLLTTQYLEEADRLADRIAIVDRGRLVADGTPGELKARAGRDVVEVHARDGEDVARAADALSRLGEPAVDRATRRVAVPVDAGADRLIEAARALDELDVAVEDIALRRPTLDEVFLALTGAPAEERA
ncbi:MAG TPA: ATP-binding cassette domain-containing protein [Solirubrobacteraceae bacterium]